MQSFVLKETGPAPIISALCHQLGVREIINNTVTWDEKQCLLDPGTLVIALIINILCGRKPLYRVEEYFREQDLALLFEVTLTSRHLNDDALTSALDRVYEAGAKKVFSAVAYRALANENVLSDILDGNLDDKTWNKQLLENLPAHFTCQGQLGGAGANYAR